MPRSEIVTKSRVCPAVCCPKANKEARWMERKKFALFLRLATESGVGCQRPTPPIGNQWTGAFTGEGTGLHANSTVSCDSPLEIGYAVVWPASSWFCLGTVNLQFQSHFVPIFLRPALETVAAYVMAYSLVITYFFHLVGVLVSIILNTNTFFLNQFSSVAQLCLTLRPHGLHHARLPCPSPTPRAYVHRVDDAIQPSHPLSSSSPPTFNLSQHRGLFKWVSPSLLMNSSQWF